MTVLKDIALGVPGNAVAFGTEPGLLVDSGVVPGGSLSGFTNTTDVGLGQNVGPSDGSGIVEIGEAAIASSQGIAIGSNASAVRGNGVAVGKYAYAQTNSVAVGYGASGNTANSIAIGYNVVVSNVSGLNIGNEITGTLGTVISFAHHVSMPGLPTSDPHIAGELWANSGVITQSAG